MQTGKKASQYHVIKVMDILNLHVTFNRITKTFKGSVEGRLGLS